MYLICSKEAIKIGQIHLLMQKDIYLLILESLLFHDRGPYHIEASPLICPANLWISFYIIETSVIKEIIVNFDYIQLLNLVFL